MISFLHTYHPQPILSQLGPIAIHWYGLLMVLAIVCGFFVVRYWWEKYQLTTHNSQLTTLDNLFFYLVIWGFVGARLYHVLNEPVYYFSHPFEIIAIWQGGLAIHGAMIAGAVVLFYVVRKNFNNITIQQSNNVSMPYGYIAIWLLIADVLVVGLALGQAIGRWGNYFNQELYGRPTNIGWGIPIDAAYRVSGFEGFQYFHPTFLYESLGSLVIFGVLWGMHWVRVSRVNPLPYLPLPGGGEELSPPWKGGEARGGLIFTTYLFLYSLLRIVVESFRIDDVPVVLGIRLPLLTSVVMMLIAFGIFVYTKKEHPSVHYPS